MSGIDILGFVVTAWEKLVRLLSLPVLWLSAKLELLSDLLSKKITKKAMRISLIVLLGVELTVFVINAILVGDLRELIKTLIGCSIYGGFLDLYETVLLRTNPGMHLWITSGIAWILGGFVNCLVEKNEQSRVMKFIHSISFLLFFSAVITPIYSILEKYFSGCIDMLRHDPSFFRILLNIIPFLLISAIILLSVISGLWISIACCYDYAFFTIFFLVFYFIAIAIVRIDTNEMLNIIACLALVAFMIVYALVKHRLAKEGAEDYETISVFHYLLIKKGSKSRLLAFVFFFFSLLGFSAFFMLVVTLLFPDFAATLAPKNVAFPELSIKLIFLC